MNITSQNILELIPQAPPFVMVGQLLYSDMEFTRTSFVISEDNCMLQNGKFTEGGLLENIAQTAAARAGYTAKQENRPVSSGYIGAVKNFEVFYLPEAGKELLTEIKIENQFFNVSVITGKVWCGDELAAQCEIKVFLNPEE